MQRTAQLLTIHYYQDEKEQKGGNHRHHHHPDGLYSTIPRPNVFFFVNGSLPSKFLSHNWQNLLPLFPCFRTPVSLSSHLVTTSF